MISNILLVKEEEVVKCASFDGAIPESVTLVFRMPNGETNEMDFETFLSCVSSIVNKGEPLNFRTIDEQQAENREYKLQESLTPLSTAYFAQNKGNGYIKVFRDLCDPDYTKYYTPLFEVPNCAEYIIAAIWDKFKNKIVLSDWLDLSAQEIQSLRLYFQTLSN